MAPRKASHNGSSLPTTPSPSSTSLASDPLPITKINNANLSEIKSALDDAVKKQVREASFTPSLLHPTVHLALGYSSVIISLGAVLYSLRISFEDSKPVLWVAVVGYSVLQSALWAWKRWVEQGEVFRGKRRRMVKRIETDHIQITSSTSLLPPPPSVLTFSPYTRPSSPSSAISSPSTMSPATLSPSSSSAHISHTRDVSRSSASVSKSPTTSTTLPAGHISPNGPTYLLNLTLSTTSNNGKSLLRRSRVVSGRCVGEFVDEDGGVEEGEVMRWLSGLLGEAGMVGAEDGEGMKEN
ncbi:MAG: hypothetical protein TREMPRED_004357 [Tremellales sp. Tagirdzhanova-0007]|nr:MAG: hypothetical protein TREMPRED_004357 [Tremellales sp. Tagirdzhanova-0007]